MSDLSAVGRPKISSRAQRLGAILADLMEASPDVLDAVEELLGHALEQGDQQTDVVLGQPTNSPVHEVQ